MKSVNYEALAERTLGLAKQRGATACDVTIELGSGQSVTVRNGKRETWSASKSQGLKLRVFVGGKTAVGRTKDFTAAGIREVVRDTIAEAKLLEVDPFAGLPASHFAARAVTPLDLVDPGLAALTPAKMLEMAAAAEEAAYAFDPRVKRTENASCRSGSGKAVYASSGGILRVQEAAGCGFSVGIVASGDNEMQTGSWGSANRRFALLEDPVAIGRLAAQEAVLKLGARKVKSGVYPVIFNQDAAVDILQSLVGAAVGSGIYMKSSFLVNRLGEKIGGSQLEVIDDALMPWGLNSTSFDDEGLATDTRHIVQNGVLQCYLHDAYSARKLNAEPNGGQKPTNLFIKPGANAPSAAALIGSVKEGLYLMGTQGHGFNPVTGDYSVGALGRWIVNGELTDAVSGITVAGHLLEMLSDVEIANDLVFRNGTNSPSLKFTMTVAGE
jgi:PmbA protein